jgi:hypothetical protein
MELLPLGLNIDLWYGVRTNYAFAGSYESANEWMHRNGKAAYGPIEPGYKDFLALLNKWYEDGILDPDFATRDQASYNALMANGGYGAMGMAYGDLGQAKRTGMSIDPNYKLTPVLQPTSYDGQVIHLHQDNSTVRTNANWVSVKALDENVIEPVVANGLTLTTASTVVISVPMVLKVFPLNGSPMVNSNGFIPVWIMMKVLISGQFTPSLKFMPGVHSETQLPTRMNRKYGTV